MLRALILAYIALIFVAEIIDRKQKYSTEEALKERPSRADQLAVEFFRRAGFIDAKFKFPSDKDRHSPTGGPPVKQEGKKAEAPEIKVPFTILLRSRLSAWHRRPEQYAADDKEPH